QYVQQMQHDARTRGADRMAQRDGAAVDVELLDIEFAQRAVETEFVAAVRFVFPSFDATEHLRGESFVDLPGVDVIEAEVVSLEQGRGGMHGTKSHLRRIECRPMRIDDATDR